MIQAKKITALTSGLMIAASALAAFPAAPVSAATLLIAEFETTDDSFTSRGSATVHWTSDQAYTQNCSLFVSGRTETWNGAQRDASSLLSAGETYKMSVAVYQESGEPVDMKFTLQFKDASGQADYDKIALEPVESGQWVVLSNDAYTVPDNATDMVIYVEAPNSKTDFYIDSVTVKGSPAVIKKGDANGNMAVDEKDVHQLADFLCCKTDEIEKGADYNGDGVINAADLTLLKHALMFPTVTPISGDWDNYQEEATGNYLKALQGGVLRVGNTARIREKIAKAQAGEKVTLGFIGGSITEGGSSTSEDKRFVNIASNYFKNTFGTGNNVSFVNAGLAGTSSVVGNMRVDNDIFAKNCDIIFIEFAVNDQGDDRFKKSYESLVKKCLMQPNEPAVGIITMCKGDLSGNEDWMVKVAENYDLPVISAKGAIQNGNINYNSEFGSGDNLHPGNGGHQIMADVISYYFRQALRSENASDSYEIPNKEVYGADYATAHLVSFDQLSGFNAGSWTKSGSGYSKNGNTPMTFSIEGKGILLLFRSKDDSSYGAVNVSANGNTNKVTSNLRWTWGGQDGNVGYYQPTAEHLDISISSADGGSFMLYGIAVIE